MKNIFEILLEHGNPSFAISNAKKLLKHHKSTSPSKIAPASKVYELVEELVQYLPEEIKERFE